MKSTRTFLLAALLAMMGGFWFARAEPGSAVSAHAAAAGAAGTSHRRQLQDGPSASAPFTNSSLQCAPGACPHHLGCVSGPGGSLCTNFQACSDYHEVTTVADMGSGSIGAVAVAPGTGDVYFSHQRAIYRLPAGAGPAALYAGAVGASLARAEGALAAARFGHITALAVAPDGSGTGHDLYLADAENHVLWRASGGQMTVVMGGGSVLPPDGAASAPVQDPLTLDLGTVRGAAFHAETGRVYVPVAFVGGTRTAAVVWYEPSSGAAGVAARVAGAEMFAVGGEPSGGAALPGGRLLFHAVDGAYRPGFVVLDLDTAVFGAVADRGLLAADAAGDGHDHHEPSQFVEGPYTTVGATPVGLTAAADADGNVYFGSHRLVKLYAADNFAALLAGTGAAHSHVDGPGTTATFDAIAGIAVAPSGDVFVGEWRGGRVRAVRKVWGGGPEPCLHRRAPETVACSDGAIHFNGLAAPIGFVPGTDADATDSVMLGTTAFLGQPAYGGAAGQVAVFEAARNGSFVRLQPLRPSAPAAGHRFGASLAGAGDVLAVGAPGMGIQGSVVMFRKVPGVGWGQQQVIDGASAGLETIGRAVSVQLLPPRRDVASRTGGPGSARMMTSSVAKQEAYIFEDAGAGWTRVDTLAPGVQDIAAFGSEHVGTKTASMAADPDTGLVVLGAPGHDAGVANHDGGAVYMWHNGGTSFFAVTWHEPAHAQFACGSSVHVQGDQLVVGCPGLGHVEGRVYVWTLQPVRGKLSWLTQGNGTFPPEAPTLASATVLMSRTLTAPLNAIQFAPQVGKHVKLANAGRTLLVASGGAVVASGVADTSAGIAKSTVGVLVVYSRQSTAEGGVHWTRMAAFSYSTTSGAPAPGDIGMGPDGLLAVPTVKGLVALLATCHREGGRCNAISNKCPSGTQCVSTGTGNRCVRPDECADHWEVGPRVLGSSPAAGRAALPAEHYGPGTHFVPPVGLSVSRGAGPYHSGLYSFDATKRRVSITTLDVSVDIPVFATGNLEQPDDITALFTSGNGLVSVGAPSPGAPAVVDITLPSDITASAVRFTTFTGIATGTDGFPLAAFSSLRVAGSSSSNPTLELLPSQAVDWTSAAVDGTFSVLTVALSGAPASKQYRLEMTPNGAGADAQRVVLDQIEVLDGQGNNVLAGKIAPYDNINGMSETEDLRTGLNVLVWHRRSEGPDAADDIRNVVDGDPATYIGMDLRHFESVPAFVPRVSVLWYGRENPIQWRGFELAMQGPGFATSWRVVAKRVGAATGGSYPLDAAGGAYEEVVLHEELSSGPFHVVRPLKPPKFAANLLEVQFASVAQANGVACTSGNGCELRVHEFRPIFSEVPDSKPKVQHVWSSTFAPDGSLYLAAGAEEGPQGLVMKYAPATGALTTVAGVRPSLRPAVPLRRRDINAVGSAAVGVPHGVAVDASGNVYVASYTSHVVYKVDAAQSTVAVVAGTLDSPGTSVGPAGSNQLSGPRGLELEATGDLLISDANNYRVVRLKVATGDTEVVAIASTTAKSQGISDARVVERGWFGAGIASDAATGAIYAASAPGGVIYKLAPGQRASIVAGAYSPRFIEGSPDPAAWPPVSADGLGSGASVLLPADVDTDAAGNVYVAEAPGAVRRIDQHGNVVTLAGLGPGASLASLAVAADGQTIWAASESGGGLVRLMARQGASAACARPAPAALETAAAVSQGDEACAAAPGGACSDPSSTCVSSGTSFFCRRNETCADHWTLAPLSWSLGGLSRAVRAAASGDLVVLTKLDPRRPEESSLLGVRSDGSQYVIAPSLPSSPAPGGLAIDGVGRIYLLDNRFASPSGLRRVVLNDAASPEAGVAGTELLLASSDPKQAGVDGPQGGVALDGPVDLVSDSSGNVLVLEGKGRKLRLFSTASDMVLTLAGTGLRGHVDGPALRASFVEPRSLAIDRTSGVAYIGDGGTLRSLSADRAVVRTVAGSQGAPPGTDGYGSCAGLGDVITSVAVDDRGAVFVAGSTAALAGVPLGAVMRVDPATGAAVRVAGRHPDEGRADVRTPVFGVASRVRAASTEEFAVAYDSERDAVLVLDQREGGLFSLLWDGVGCTAPEELPGDCGAARRAATERGDVLCPGHEAACPAGSVCVADPGGGWRCRLSPAAHGGNATCVDAGCPGLAWSVSSRAGQDMIVEDPFTGAVSSRASRGHAAGVAAFPWDLPAGHDMYCPRSFFVNHATGHVGCDSWSSPSALRQCTSQIGQAEIPVLSSGPGATGTLQNLTMSKLVAAGGSSAAPGTHVAATEFSLEASQVPTGPGEVLLHVVAREVAQVRVNGKVALMKPTQDLDAAATLQRVGIDLGLEVDAQTSSLSEQDAAEFARALTSNTGAAGWAREAKLLASDGAAGDAMGAAVAISGDVMVVCSPLDDDKGADSGSVYVFTRSSSGSAWTEAQKLTASDGTVGARFGDAVAFDGDTLVVGAYWDNDNGAESGSAYVFTRSGSDGTWTETQKLTASDGTSYDWFSYADGVAVSGDTIVVGSHGTASRTGAAYVFTRGSDGTWTETQKLTASDGEANDVFGLAVDMWGDTIVISAPEDDDKGTNAGAAYVFVRGGDGVWTEVQKLTASDGAAHDVFGFPSVIHENTIFVGASGDDDRGTDSGAVYVFTRGSSGGAWTEAQKLTASDGAQANLDGSRMALQGDRLVVSARRDDDLGTDAGAAYVFVRAGDGTWTEVRKLTASDGAAGDQFGVGLAMSGDTIVVGARLDDDNGSNSGSVYVFDRIRDVVVSPNPLHFARPNKLLASDGAAGDAMGAAVAISGDVMVVCSPSDGDKGADSGSVYVFTRSSSGSAWTETQKLTASDGAAGDRFGHSVVVDGDVIVVGAYHEDDRSGDAGAAYVFTRGSDGTWTETQKLTASDGVQDDWFGWRVDLDGDTMVVSSVFEDDKGTNAGAVYVFVRGGDGTWTEVQKLTASDGAADDLFGEAVALDGDTMVVGAYGVNDKGTTAGAAYVFVRGGDGVWTEVQKLTASDGAAHDLFGEEVALDGDRIVITSYADDGVAWYAGAAYMFVRGDDGMWREVQKLVASDGAQGDFFGRTVAIKGDAIVIGATEDDDRGQSSGSAYIFEVGSDGTWTEVRKLTASDGAAGDQFGVGLAMSGDTIVVGARLDDDNGSNSGSVYVFDRVRLGLEKGVNGDAFVPAVVLGSGVQGKLVASDGAMADEFGSAVAVSGDVMVVGARDDDDVAPDAGSAYVFTRSGADGAWTETQKLTAADGGQNDFFGQAVAASGDTIAVGAPDNDGKSDQAGAVYVYTRGSGGAFGQVQKLTSSGPGQGELFGTALAVAGDTMAVGAPLYDGAAGADQGAVYVIVRGSGGTWMEVQRLTASDAAAADIFGWSLALDSDALVVGARQHDAGGLGVDSGAAYVFMRSSDRTWAERQKLTASDGYVGAQFGFEMAVSGDTMMVSAVGIYASPATTSKHVYVFVRDSDGGWREMQKLEASDAGQQFDVFGFSLALQGDLAVVGNYLNGDGGVGGRGSVYVLARGNDGLWAETQKLMAGDASTGDWLGWSVSLSGETVVAGARFDDAPGTFQEDNRGSVYVWRLASHRSSWTNERFDRIVPAPLPILRYSRLSPASPGDQFGFQEAVAVSGDFAVVGAPYTDCEGATNCGRMYVFARASDGAWVVDWSLTGSDSQVHNFLFGYSVAIHGDTIVVGALRPDRRGAAYVFARAQEGSGVRTSWSERQILVPQNPDANGNLVLDSSGGYFGESVAISEGLIVVGAHYADNFGVDSGSIYAFKQASDGTWGWFGRYQPTTAGESQRYGYRVSSAPDDNAVVVGSVAGGAFVVQSNGAQLVEVAKLGCSDKLVPGSGQTTCLEGFGVAVAASSDTIVVGAPHTDNGAGSVYVYMRGSHGKWGRFVSTTGNTHLYVESLKLTAVDGSAGYGFGAAVAVTRDIMVLGAPNHIIAGMGGNVGAAYVYKRGVQDTWRFAHKVLATDGAPNDAFGTAVAASGNTFAVGARFDDNDKGSAHIYTVSDKPGLRPLVEVVCDVIPSAVLVGAHAKLLASDAAAGDRFGHDSVAIDGDIAIVSAAYDDDNGQESGSVYVFMRSGDNDWAEVQKLTASDGAQADFFGVGVAIDGDTVVIGAPHDDDVIRGSDSGSAYVFVRVGDGTWTETQKLTASDGAAGDRFGHSVVVDGDVIVVGAYHEDDRSRDTGAAYVFTRGSDGTWTEMQKLTASDGVQDDWFGWRVDLDGDTMVVSSLLEDDKGTNAGAAYVFVRGGDGTWTEVQKLTASDGAAHDLFAEAVALDGDTMVVGALGVDDKGTNAGAAYVFVRGGDGTWTEVQKLTASDWAPHDLFGEEVALDGDRLVIASYADDGVALDAAAAYVFVRGDDGMWREVQKLVASDGAQGDGRRLALAGDIVIATAMSDSAGFEAGSAYVFVIQDAQRAAASQGPLCVQQLRTVDALPDDAFGGSVSVDGDTVVVGATLDDDAGWASGSAYVYVRDDAGAVVQVQKLTASDGAAGDRFGHSVVVDGDVIVVGAYHEDDRSRDAGAAYVFTRGSDGTWTEMQKLTASDGVQDDWFGWRVDLDGDTMVVSSVLEDDKGTNAGAVYVFVRGGDGTWTEVQKLTASDGAAHDLFGEAVALDGDTMVVGAYGVNDKGTTAGAAYVFVRGGDGTWTEVQKLTASDGAAHDRFGEEVALDGDRLVITSYADDDVDWDAGAAYVLVRGDDGMWREVQKLVASDGAQGDFFGRTVAIKGDAIVIGAPEDDDRGQSSGSAYIFEVGSDGKWTQSEKLLALPGARGEGFGGSVAMTRDGFIAVGAPGSQQVPEIYMSSAYVFTRSVGRKDPAPRSWIKQNAALQAGKNTIEIVVHNSGASSHAFLAVGFAGSRAAEFQRNAVPCAATDLSSTPQYLAATGVPACIAGPVSQTTTCGYPWDAARCGAATCATGEVCVNVLTGYACRNATDGGGCGQDRWSTHQVGMSVVAQQDPGVPFYSLGAMTNMFVESAVFGPDGLLYATAQVRAQTSNVAYANVVVRVLADGTSELVAGTPSSGGARSQYRDGPCLSAKFVGLSGLDFDGNGNLYVADREAHVLAYIDLGSPGGCSVTTVAGVPGVPWLYGTPVSGQATRRIQPMGLVVEPSGAVLFYSGSGVAGLMRYDPASKTVELVGRPGSFDGSEARNSPQGGALAATHFGEVQHLKLDAATTDVLVPDPHRGMVRRVSSQGLVSVLFGDGREEQFGQSASGYGRDAGPMSYHENDTDGIFVGDVAALPTAQFGVAHLVSTTGSRHGVHILKDGQSRTVFDPLALGVPTAGMSGHIRVATGANGKIYAITKYQSPLRSQIFELSLAGGACEADPVPYSPPAGGSACDLCTTAGACFSEPSGRSFCSTYKRCAEQWHHTSEPIAIGHPGASGMAVAANGDVYVSIESVHTVYRMNLTSNSVAVAAGDGNAGMGTTALSASLSSPRGLAVSRDGTLFVACVGSSSVRAVKDGVVTTVLSGSAAPSGSQPVPGAVFRDLTRVPVAQPSGLFLDDDEGLLYVTDAGSGVLFVVDVGAATARVVASGLGDARGVVAPHSGGIQAIVADTAGGKLWRVDAGRGWDAPPARLLVGAAGAGHRDGPLSVAMLSAPASLAMDGDDAILVATAGGVRRLALKHGTDGTLATLARDVAASAVARGAGARVGQVLATVGPATPTGNATLLALAVKPGAEAMATALCNGPRFVGLEPAEAADACSVGRHDCGTGETCVPSASRNDFTCVPDQTCGSAWSVREVAKDVYGHDGEGKYVRGRDVGAVGRVPSDLHADTLWNSTWATSKSRAPWKLSYDPVDSGDGIAATSLAAAFDGDASTQFVTSPFAGTPTKGDAIKFKLLEHVVVPKSLRVECNAAGGVGCLRDFELVGINSVGPRRQSEAAHVLHAYTGAALTGVSTIDLAAAAGARGLHTHYDSFELRIRDWEGRSDSQGAVVEVVFEYEDVDPRTIVSAPAAVAGVPGGNVVYAEASGTVREIALDPTGNGDFTLAGQVGHAAHGAVDGNAFLARFGQHLQLAVPPGATSGTGPQGRMVYVSDFDNHCVRLINSGAVSTVVGQLGVARAPADTGTTHLSGPRGIVVSPDGLSLYVADETDHRILVVTLSTGVAAVFAGETGVPGSTDGPLSGARLRGPAAVAVDSTDRVFIADRGNNMLRMVVSGEMRNVAGSPGQAPPVAGTQWPAFRACALIDPTAVVVDQSDNVLLFDAASRHVLWARPNGTLVSAVSPRMYGGSQASDVSVHMALDPDGSAVYLASNEAAGQEGLNGIVRVVLDVNAASKCDVHEPKVLCNYGWEDECTEGSDGCARSEYCVDNPTGYSCNCLSGFTADGTAQGSTEDVGIFRECLDVNECLSSTACPAQYLCTNTPGSYYCTYFCDSIDGVASSACVADI